MCEHLLDGKVTQNFTLLEDGYAINGCCGGGCYVIHGIIYCPYCGEKLKGENCGR